MLKQCPDPVETQDLQFKLHCRLKIFDNKDLTTFSELNNLVACASRYGLVFLGSNVSNLQVIQVKCTDNFSTKDKEISEYPCRIVPLPSAAKHVKVNCDSTILAVVVERDSCPLALFYDVPSFYKQNISLIREVRLSSTPKVLASEIGWNPALPNVFTVCKSNHTLGIYTLGENSIDINELPTESNATSFCWSPKGKQIAVGSTDGKITQYKPDLKAARVINAPPLEGGPHALISLQWISNYQFIGAYRAPNPEAMSSIIVVDAPKTGETVYTNYDDICYSGSGRPHQFYMEQILQWNVLLVASSNSTELGVLGSVNDVWTQWILSDSGRAELPLSFDRQETFPVGLDVDYSSVTPLPWGESEIPPCPKLFLLSHHGVLCLFNIVNLKKDIPNLCSPPECVQDTSGLALFKNKPISSGTEESTAVTASVPVSVNTAQKLNPSPQIPTSNFSFASGFQESTPKNIRMCPVSTPLTPQITQNNTLAFNGQTTLNLASKNTSVVKPEPKINSQQQNITPQAKNITIVPRVEKNNTVNIEDKIDANIKAKNRVLLSQMLKDESTFLESEVKSLLYKGEALNIPLGSDYEILMRKINSLDSFVKELTDICVGQSLEIHSLKQTLILCWAWYEEAKSRYHTSMDEAILLIVRSQPLDSATQKRKKDIQHFMNYIETQLSTASKALDEQWDKFQDYAKKIHRVQLPTMEAIFQTMVRQNIILQKQMYILKDISERLKARNHISNSGFLIQRSKKEQDSDVIDSSPNNYQDRCKQMFSTTNDFSAKTNKLHNMLKNRQVRHITATKFDVSVNLSAISKSKLAALQKASESQKLNEETPASKITMFTPIDTKTDTMGFTPQANIQNLQPKSISFSIAEAKPDINSPQFIKVDVPTIKPAISENNAPTQAFSFTKSSSNSAALFAPNVQTSISQPASTSSNIFSFGGLQTSTPVPLQKQPPNSMQMKSNTQTSTQSSKISVETMSRNLPISTNPNISVLATSSVSETTPLVSKTQFSFSASNTSSNSGALFSQKLSTTATTSATKQFVFDSNSKASVAGLLSSTPVVTISKENKMTPTTTTPGFNFSSFASQKSSQSPTVATSSPFFAKAPETSTNSSVSSAPTTLIFSNTSIFGQPAKTESTTAQKTMVTSTPVSTIFSSMNLFGQLPKPENVSEEVNKSEPNKLTAENTTSTAVTPTASIFGQLTKTGSISQAADTAISKSPIQSTTSSTIPTTKSIFGQATKPENSIQISDNTAVKTSVMATSVVTSPSNTSVFGQLVKPVTTVETADVTSASKTQVSTTSTTSTAGSSLFGQLTKPDNQVGSIDLGKESVTKSEANTNASLATSTVPFGSQPSSSIFGSSSFVTSSNSSIFGASSLNNTKISTSLFGSTTTTTSSTLFGTPTPTTSSTLFGTPTPTTTTVSSVFAQSSSIFAPQSSTNPLVQNSTTLSNTAAPISTSVTGCSAFSSTGFSFVNALATNPAVSTPNVQPVSPLEENKGSIFGASINSNTTGSIFGGGAPQSSFGFSGGATNTTTASASFGFGGLNVGGGSTATSSGSIFGAKPFGASTVANPFGKAQSQPAFSTSNTNLFGSASTSSSIFGSANTMTTTSSQSVFGTGPSVFGSAPAFGQAKPTFGQNPSSPFGSSQPTGPFSAGSSSIAQGGFGSSGDFQKPAFGGSPTFGGAPAFGSPPVFGSQSPTFGGAPKFGGSPMFGSPGKIFGGGSPTVDFGSAAAQQNASFGNLANQETIGFGNLAQQASSQSAPFSGNPSFSSWR